MNTLLERANQVLMFLEPKPADLQELRRFGSSNDGGYLMIDDLNHSDFLISMGVADDVNFERDVVGKIAGVHLYDNSIDQLPSEVANSHFYAQRIGGAGGTSLKQTIERVEPGFSLLLKMDIEGSEWETLDDVASGDLDRFRQMVIEFHKFANIGDDEYFNRFKRVFEKIEKTHFIMNSHPNNCGGIVLVENLTLPNVIEITFLRRSDYPIDHSKKAECSNLLSALNQPCAPTLADIYLYPPIDANSLNLESQSAGIHTIYALNSTAKQLSEIKAQYEEILESTFWRLGAPLRYISRLLRRLWS